MTSDFSNDNSVNAMREPDAHGQTAMLLVESLIHGLIARSLITVADAVEIVETAREVQVDAGAEPDALAATRRSISLLQAISSSLRGDLPEP